MLVTDVGDEMCWWQLWDIGDGFDRFCHQHPLSFNISVGHQHPKIFNKIKSPVCHQHLCSPYFILFAIVIIMIQIIRNIKSLIILEIDIFPSSIPKIWNHLVTDVKKDSFFWFEEENSSIPLCYKWYKRCCWFDTLCDKIDSNIVTIVFIPWIIWFEIKISCINNIACDIQVRTTYCNCYAAIRMLATKITVTFCDVVGDRIKILVTSFGCWTLMLIDRGCWWPKRPKLSPTS